MPLYNMLHHKRILFFCTCPGSRTNSGIASVYGHSRYLDLIHIFTFRHFSSRLLASKSSKNSSKFFCKSGRQPFHFFFCRVVCSVCIKVKCHRDVLVPHYKLQCFRVHSCICHICAERMPEHMWREYLG